jgi:predicted naringenin-chalcone synthase
MKPKIISLGYALPAFSYSQDQIFNELGYPRPFWRLFRHAQIEKRHFAIPLERIRKLSFQEQQEEYTRWAIELSKQAVINCLDNRSCKDVGLVTFSSCTGFCPGPVIPHYLARELNFEPETFYTNIGSMGCEGGYPGLKRALDFTIATGKSSLVIATELSSCSYFPEPDGKPDPENEYELLRSNAIFADASVCALIGFDDNPNHPYIVDTATFTDTRYLGDLGYIWRDGRLRVRLSRRVPVIAAELVEAVVPILLTRHGISLKRINHWIIHAAGNQVLDNIKFRLGLPEEKLYWSRETLRLFGNCSSTTVGLTGKLFIEQANPKPNDYVVMVSLGPGMTAGATLLKFGNG